MVKIAGPVPPTLTLDSAVSAYRGKTRASARLFARSSRLHVNGVSHNIRFFEPYPFVVRSARGKSLVDVDSNSYTDYWMGHWSLILGHAPRAVGGALARQAKLGWMYGTVNEQTIQLSGMIAGAVPAAEKIRYATSGTEATMYAVRLARTATGKKIIAKVDGGWHGYTSDLLKSVNWPFTKPESGGMLGASNIISIPYNDLHGALAILERHANDLAGVMIEPVLGGGGCIPADAGYLRGIEEFAKRNGSLFMLDEIVTGFRFRFGCLYTTMKLNPDIVTLGKIVGGGMPIGVICGSDEVMAHADTLRNAKESRAYVGGGTFSANPASMSAGLATLKKLKATKSTYQKIGELGRMARDGISRAFDGRAAVTGMGSLFMAHFLKDGITEVRNAADAARCDTAMLARYHFEMIAKDGIFFLPGKLGAASTSHTKADIRGMVEASARFHSESRRSQRASLPKTSK